MCQMKLEYGVSILNPFGGKCPKYAPKESDKSRKLPEYVPIHDQLMR